jgi:hypothetical protein
MCKSFAVNSPVFDSLTPRLDETVHGLTGEAARDMSFDRRKETKPKEGGRTLGEDHLNQVHTVIGHRHGSAFSCPSMTP